MAQIERGMVSQPGSKLLPNLEPGGQANIDDSCVSFQLLEVEPTAFAIWQKGEVLPSGGQSLGMPFGNATYQSRKAPQFIAHTVSVCTGSHAQNISKSVLPACHKQHDYLQQCHH